MYYKECGSGKLKCELESEGAALFSARSSVLTRTRGKSLPFLPQSLLSAAKAVWVVVFPFPRRKEIGVVN